MRALQKWDQKNLWHPFTQASEWDEDLQELNLIISKGRGIYLYDSDGKKYIDGVSSLWANVHGHHHPVLNAAIRKQLNRVAHSTFLGLTHEPGIQLARELVQIAPKGLTRVFYSDNGATSVEVALKMSYQFHAQTRGGAKSEFLALENSYHGDTLGAVSVGGIGLFHRKFRKLLFKTHFAMSPHCLRCPFNKRKNRATESYSYRGESPNPGDFRKETGCKWECLGTVESILKKRKGKIAAAIAEPVVQGAAGILVAPPGYLKGFAKLCKKYEALLILDEVAVGFGRTGKMFALEHEKVTPDFLCLAKGISGGYLPLAATLSTEKIYRAFLGRYDEFKTFFHGHTYTGHPLACAAGLASQRIFRENKTLNHVQNLSRVLTARLQKISRFPMVGQTRQAGLVAGVELVKNKRTLECFPPRLRLGKRVCTEARKHGILLRPLGDVIVLIPPLTIRENQLNSLMTGLEKSIQTITEQAQKDERNRT